MTSPGRTHIPWETQDGQVKELITYIGFLEAKLQYLQSHHESCNLFTLPLTLDPNLPYLPPDIVVANDEAEKANNHFPITPTSPLETHFPHPSTAVQPLTKKKITTPRWKRIVDQMMTGWDKPSSWEDKRVSIGLDTLEKNQYALTLILGLKKDMPQTMQLGTSQIGNGQINSSAYDSLIFSARQYALETKASETNAGFVVQIHIFRELVFASLCVVMEHQGLPIETINDLMRICMSSSGPANLYRLRRGALWANRVISGTLVKKLGWNYNATEFFLLSGRPVSQYGLLWEACAHSFPYLSQQLMQVNSLVNVPVDGPGWTPFSIPLIIKGLVGDALSLPQICTALDYDPTALWPVPHFGR